jgi:hypothetical protein
MKLLNRLNRAANMKTIDRQKKPGGLVCVRQFVVGWNGGQA